MDALLAAVTQVTSVEPESPSSLTANSTPWSTAGPGPDVAYLNPDQTNTTNDDADSVNLSEPTDAEDLPAKKRRFRIPRHLVSQLKTLFAKDPKPSAADIEAIASRLGMTDVRVKIWFQNMRTRFLPGVVPDSSAGQTMLAPIRQQYPGHSPLSQNSALSSSKYGSPQQTSQPWPQVGLPTLSHYVLNRSPNAAPASLAPVTLPEYSEFNAPPPPAYHRHEDGSQHPQQQERPFLPPPQPTQSLGQPQYSSYPPSQQQQPQQQQQIQQSQPSHSPQYQTHPLQYQQQQETSSYEAYNSANRGYDGPLPPGPRSGQYYTAGPQQLPSHNYPQSQQYNPPQSRTPHQNSLAHYYPPPHQQQQQQQQHPSAVAARPPTKAVEPLSPENNSVDDDDASSNQREGGNFDYKKSKRFIMSRDHLKWLKKIFDETPFPSGEQMQHISDVVGMDRRQVRVWFQNRRAVEKRKGLALQAVSDKVATVSN
ncbi:UNVERIFIED_CONTAM: hypothetical protein HDU68_003630 [Siphonaria sp. JEL0065]|nr:hypothetical protein HDU68_003630 [Siphonaria sp. JEL0065]